jgi:hypothetical protein
MSELAEMRRRVVRIPRYVGEEETAHHEAGHAVAAVVLKRRISYVTIIAEGGDDGHLGLCRLGDLPTLREYLDGTTELADRARKQGERDLTRSAIISAAGPAATFRHRGGAEVWDDPGLIADRNATTGCAAWLAGSSDGASLLVDRWHAEATKIVQEHWTAVCSVAEELLRERVLSGQRVRQLARA